MNAHIFWFGQHLKQAARDTKFAAKCWWLSQRVDFLEWRWQIDGRLSQPQSAAVPIQMQSRSGYAAQSA